MHLGLEYSRGKTSHLGSLMKQRDIWKQSAKDIAKLSPVPCPEQIQAWGEYKKYITQVNNRKKTEGKMYKSGKMAENSDSPEIVWENEKLFMGWKTN